MREIIPIETNNQGGIDYSKALNMIGNLPQGTQITIIQGDNTSFIRNGFYHAFHSPDKARQLTLEKLNPTTPEPLCASATYTSEQVKRKINGSLLRTRATEHRITFNVATVYGSLIPGQITPEPLETFTAVYYTPTKGVFKTLLGKLAIAT